MKPLLVTAIVLSCALGHAYNLRGNTESKGIKKISSIYAEFKSIDKTCSFLLDIDTYQWSYKTYRKASEQLKPFIEKARKVKSNVNWDEMDVLLQYWEDEYEQLIDADFYETRADEYRTGIKGGEPAVKENINLNKALTSYYLAYKWYSEKRERPSSSLIYVRIGDLLQKIEQAPRICSNSAIDWYEMAIDLEKKLNKGTKLGQAFYLNDEDKKLSYGLIALAKHYVKLKPSSAMKFYREAYREKDFDAAFAIGDTYLKPENNKRPDYDNAIKYYGKGIEFLKECGYNPIKVRKQLHTYTLLMYQEARTKDEMATLKELLEQSATFGFEDASYYLGTMYLEGKGCKKDLKKAFEWLTLSHKMGYEKSITAQMAIIEQLSDKDIVSYKKYAEEFVAEKQKLIDENEVIVDEFTGEEHKVISDDEKLALAYIKLCEKHQNKINLDVIPDRGSKLRHAVVPSVDSRRVEYLHEACRRAIKKNPKYLAANSKYLRAKGFNKDEARNNLNIVTSKIKEKLLETDKKFAAMYNEKKEIENRSNLAILKKFVDEQIELKKPFPENFIKFCKEQTL